MRQICALLLLAVLAAAAASPPRIVQIKVTDQGFVPTTVQLQVGQPARLIFTRTSDNTCATAVNLPGLHKGPVTLPLNRPIGVTVTPGKPGNYTFACPMDMVRGDLKVK